MCGIYFSTKPFSEQVFNEKLNRVSFRGPDYQCVRKVDENVFMGHLRLAIIDLDERSNQPFSYRHLSIVFNGEIYNFPELKRELSAKGYPFRTGSDTEVILAAYLEYGESCVDRFNGMFAFVIYDPETKSVFGARDRLGKKPMYYRWSESTLEIASQPSQIKAGNKLDLDESAVLDYLEWGYVPEPKSIWKQVKKMEAGTSFRYDIGTNNLQIRKYWELETDPGNYTGSYEEAQEELHELLKDAVKVRMISDVPLGVFLSGGVDSSLVAALARAYTPQLNTFSVKFNETGFDESAYAEQVARHLGTHHHTIECNYGEGMDLIRNVHHYYDEPFADSSAIPSMLLAKHTRQEVTVALSGDGGDEAYLGYGRYTGLGKMDRLFRLPYALRALGATALKLSPDRRHRLMGMGLKERSVEDLYLKLISRGLNHYWIEDDNQVNKVPHVGFLHTKKNIWERVSDFDIKTYLNGDINTKVDRASMAYSLETRAPLMDYRVFEFSRAIPTSYKFSGQVQKRILKDILYQYVPKEFFDRPKAGFTMPFKDWFRKDLKEFVMDELCLENLKKIPGIYPEKALIMIDEHMKGTANRYPSIWSLLVLKQWMEHNC